MRPTRERQGQPDRSRTGASRSIPDRKAGDNPRRGKPDRSRSGAKRPPNPVELVKIRKDEIRASDIGLDLIQASDPSDQRTLLDAQKLDDALTSISSNGIAANQLLYGTNTDTFSKTTISDFIVGLLAKTTDLDSRDYIGAEVCSVVLTGTNASGTATTIDLKTGTGVTLEPGNIGVPVAASMRATNVAVSWLASSAPSNWTLRLHKRTGSGTMNEVATFTVNTT